MPSQGKLSGLVLAALLCIAVAPAVAGADTPKSGARGKAATLSSVALSKLTVETSSSDSNYTVVDSRFDETGTAGALFGIVGASVNSGINAAEDGKKADRFREAAAKIDLAGFLTRSAAERLGAQDNPALATAKAEASHALVIEIHNWGLIRAARDDPRMRSFLNVSWKILDAKDSVVFEKSRENAVSPTLRALGDFTDEILTTEMETLASKTGQQIAYQIIYR